jgi:hypothetical protein
VQSGAVWAEFGGLRVVEGEGGAPGRGIVQSGCSNVARAVEASRVVDPVTEALERALGHWKITQDQGALAGELIAILRILRRVPTLAR